MKTLVCTKPGAFEYVETQKPHLTEDHAVIRIIRVGVCGTDLHAFRGTQPFFTYPRILGHELAAELVEADNAPGFTSGQQVTCIPYLNCGLCIACRKGKPNCCVNIQVCGVHTDGGMAQYISVPSAVLLHGSGLKPDQLALAEPLAIGAHGIRRAGVQPGEYILIMGAGPIGLAAMEFARIAGAKVIALDMNENRLHFCHEKLGVKYCINTKTGNVLSRIAEITNGDMPTVVIDATGNLAAINKGIDYLAHGGRYVLIGLQKDDFCFNHPEFHKRETTLMSSRNATRQDFDHAIASIKSGAIDPEVYITHRVKFDDVKANFAGWLEPQNNVIKAMVSMD